MAVFQLQEVILARKIVLTAAADQARVPHEVEKQKFNDLGGETSSEQQKSGLRSYHSGNPGVNLLLGSQSQSIIPSLCVQFQVRNNQICP